MDSYHGCSVDGCCLCQLSLVKGKPPIIVNACTGGTLENIYLLLVSSRVYIVVLNISQHDV